MSRFDRAPEEIRDLAGRVLSEKFPTLARLRPEPPNIAWTVADVLTSGGRVLPTKTRITSLEDRILGHPDVIITVNQQVWSRLGPLSREAALASALYALDPVLVPTMDEGPRAALDSANRPILRSVRPDIVLAGYGEIAAWYGPHALVVKAHQAIGESLRQLVLDFLGTSPDASPLDTAAKAVVAFIERNTTPEVETEADRRREELNAQLHAMKATEPSNDPDEDVDLVEAQRLQGMLSDDASSPAAESWRGLGLDELVLNRAIMAGLTDDGLTTLGALSDFFRDTGLSDLGLSRRWGITTAEVAEIRDALEKVIGRELEGATTGPAPEVSWRVEPVTELVKHGLSENVAAILSDTEGVTDVGQLFDLVEAGELADRAASLSDEEVEEVLRARRHFLAQRGLEEVETAENTPAAEDCCADCGEVWTDCRCAESTTAAESLFPGIGDAIRENEAIKDRSESMALAIALRENVPDSLLRQWKDSGADDAVLRRAIREHWGQRNDPAEPRAGSGYVARGGVRLAFWFGDATPVGNITGRFRKPDLIGQTLIDRVRKAAGIPDPETDDQPAAPVCRPKPRRVPVVESPGEDGVFLVYCGRQKSPVYAVRARSKLEAIDYVKSQHPDDARMRVEPDDGTAKRLGLAVRDLVAHPGKVCTHCNGQPRMICPACGKLAGPSSNPSEKPRRERPAARVKPRRKPAGPAEAVAG